jgi:multiple sugar transport system permease protein
MKKRSGMIRFKENLWGYAFIAPVFLGIALFTVLPLILSVYASFTSWPGASPIFSARLTGVKNYATIFTDALFWRSMLNTVFYMIGIPIGLALSMLAALGMNRKIVGAKTFRVIYYLPVISSVVAVSLLFRSIFNLNGMLNRFLGFFKIAPVPWSYAPYNRISLVILMVWRGLGGSTLLLIAGLQGVSPTYYEAAKLDGAGAPATFFRIVLPLLKPVLFYLVVTSIIGGAQLYTEPNLIYGNDNQDVITVVQYIYQKRFARNLAGVASAAAMILAVFIFSVTTLQFGINGKREKA